MLVVAGVSENLCFEFHYGHDLVTTDVLPVLQQVLAEVTRTMAAGLEVHAYERDPERRRVNLGDPGSLRAAVVAKGTERGALYQDLAASHGLPARAAASGMPCYSAGPQDGQVLPERQLRHHDSRPPFR